MSKTVMILGSWDESFDAHRRGTMSDAALTGVYVALRVQQSAGVRWLQGDVSPPWHCASAEPPLRLFASKRLHQVTQPVAQGLLAWGAGKRSVELRFDVPTAGEVLALQARGRRCVSLLPDDVSSAPHADGLAFAVHDMCHLEKFYDPATHAGQIGFFQTVYRAHAGEHWRPFEAMFDAVWQSDRDHVIADMNGSPIFLFAALKMKLKMAVRRALRRRTGSNAPTEGPLTDEESEAFDKTLSNLFTLLRLPREVQDAARAVSTRRDHREAALDLERYFSDIGARVLNARS